MRSTETLRILLCKFLMSPSSLNLTVSAFLDITNCYFSLVHTESGLKLMSNNYALQMNSKCPASWKDDMVSSLTCRYAIACIFI